MIASLHSIPYMYMYICTFQDAICTSLSEYNAHIEELKQEMKGATDSAKNIRADIQEIRNKYSGCMCMSSFSNDNIAKTSLVSLTLDCHNIYQYINSQKKSKTVGTVLSSTPQISNNPIRKHILKLQESIMIEYMSNGGMNAHRSISIHEEAGNRNKAKHNNIKE